MEENKLNEEVKETVEDVVEATEETSEEVIETPAEVTEEKPPYNGPKVTVATRYDYTTLKYFNMMSMVYKRHYPILYLVLALFCVGYTVVMLLTSIIPSIKESGFEASQLLLPAIFVVFGGYSIYLFFNFEKSIDKNLTMHFNQYPEVTTVKCEITLEGITVTSSKYPENVNKYDWVYITEIVEIPGYYYFYSGKQPIIVSKDFNNIVDGDAETLKQIIAEQINTKPYKLIDKEIIKIPVTYVHQCDANAYEAEIYEEPKEDEE